MSCVGQWTVVRGEWPPWPREMALGIISRTSTSPGLIESSRVTKKFSPEFQFNLSQKKLARQANNKRRKPKVTPARLHHSKLSLRSMKEKHLLAESLLSLFFSSCVTSWAYSCHHQTTLQESNLICTLLWRNWVAGSLRMRARNKKVLMGHKVRINESPWKLLNWQAECLLHSVDLIVIWVWCMSTKTGIMMS